MEIILSAEPIDAEEAYRIGLMNKVFPKESLMEDSRRFAQRFSQKAAVALRLAMEAIRRGLEMSFERGLELEASLAGLMGTGEDVREGTKAFFEKGKPIFKDR